MRVRLFGQWVLFGFLFAFVGFVELLIATDQVLSSLFIAAVIGIGGGIVAGSIFLLLVQLLNPNLEGATPGAQPRASSRVLEIVVVLALASGSGVARSAGAPWYVSVPMLVLATLLLIGARLLERHRQSHAVRSKRLPPSGGRQPPGWWWDDEREKFQPPRR